MSNKDKYKTIKTALSNLFVNQALGGYATSRHRDVVLDAVKRTNLLTKRMYLLLNLALYHAFEQDGSVVPQIPIVDDDYISACQIALQIPSAAGRPPKPSKLMEINKFKALNLALPNTLPLVNAENLGNIMDEERKLILTALENNIKQHFITRYINRYVNAVFIKDDNDDEEQTDEQKKASKKALRLALYKVKQDIRSDTLTSDPEYHHWLQTNRYLLMPKTYEKNYHYDIKVNPQRYLPHMIYINKELERMGKKLFQVLPLRKSSVPKYITLETTSMIRLFGNNIPNCPIKKSVLMVSVSEHQDLIWNNLIKIPKKPCKDYSFSYCILTDGVSASVRYIEDSKNVAKKEKIDRMRIGRKAPEQVKVQKRLEKEQFKEHNKKRKAESELDTSHNKTKRQKLAEDKALLKRNNPIAYKELLKKEKGRKRG